MPKRSNKKKRKFLSNEKKDDDFSADKKKKFLSNEKKDDDDFSVEGILSHIKLKESARLHESVVYLQTGTSYINMYVGENRFVYLENIEIPCFRSTRKPRQIVFEIHEAVFSDVHIDITCSKFEDKLQTREVEHFP